MGKKEYEPVIGIEVHAQLLSDTKIFCACRPEYGAEPNTRVCPVCLGLPGALPVLSEQVVDMAVMMGLALGCEIAPRSIFARKNYFYPDCPRNYQISMYDRPLCENGELELEPEEGAGKVRIERIHLEDDAGKMTHTGEGASHVDFNRCGVPLIEIVTRPDIRSAEQASGYLKRLRQILRYLRICDGNLEEGSMRCDVNISVRETGSDELGTKTEIKNLNSFKAVEKGIEFEVERQIGVLESGGRISQVTNLWDADNQRLVMMRSKEEAHDYRYFPEPDLLPLEVSTDRVKEIGRELPELPLEREKRFRESYGLSAYDASVICAERSMADYYEEVAEGSGLPKKSANWVMREVMGELKKSGVEIEDFAVESTSLAELVKLISGGTISGSAGSEVFEKMVRTGKEAKVLVNELGLEQISESSELEDMAERIIAEHPEEAADYRAGKKKLIGFFMGQVMRESGGKANPGMAREILTKKLED
ncbi:MAG: Asp-tRNA(Asn)/Glu-tRNA(Gln) amidotransferase subunit GatB [Candidatus Latescibacteria bacterium]|nr:Asp-tRNA(Asn)/Glu-tRNA(Gln) amidotransferase subunit GatB [bacterium]MBD3425560.1 Asp-tRNA(Asn)/Glu-tRNA(Gln) amidotransferase subunit GatB [Candidatus Latescibacterota bacterium]